MAVNDPNPPGPDAPRAYPARPGLSLRTLDRLPADVRPAVRPDALTAGVLHLGLGAFHRAHQAVYTEQAMAAAGGDWGIVGVAPRSRDVLERLAAQDGLYSVVTISGAGSQARVVGSLTELRHAASDPLGVVTRIADPRIRIVTLTVTEKAYRLGPDGRLQVDDALRAELTGAAAPASALGLLTHGLITRVTAGGAPLAVVCCDNLAANGVRLRGLVEQCLQVAGGRLAAMVADQIGTQLTFPSTMVDRIVPATTAETLAQARACLGLVDAAPVAAEPFRQWVVEDRFPAGRPAWESVGAVLTDDVAPWETLKLRVLNAVHSALAYLGALAGAETIAAALALPGAHEVLRRFVAEDVAPTLRAPRGQSLQRYGCTVFERIANPAIGHRTLQVAMDGTQKLPYRLLATIAERRAAGALPHWAALVVAAWMRFVRGVADDGRRLPLDDPLADRVHAAVASAPDTPRGLAEALFGLDEVFDAGLAGDEALRADVVEWLTALDRHGVAATLQATAR